MKQNFIDRLVSIVAPGAAVERMRSRAILDRLENGKRKYDAASRSRHTEGWLASSNSANTEIITALSWLRNRSRDLGRNNPYAINALRVIPNNVVGTGIIPSIKVSGKRANSKLNDKWKKWAEKTKCDYDENLNLYGLQRLAMRTVQESGECFAVRVRETKEYDIPLKIQLLEADYLDTGKYEQQTKEGGMIYYGIEFDSRGRRKGYWLYNKHPNEFAANSRFVDAKDVIHLYEVERPGQIRGVPFSKGSMLRMNDLDDYEFAERMRAKVAACFAAFVTMDSGAESDGAADTLFDKIEPGAVMHMKPGEQVSFNSPPTTNGYPEYVKNNLRAIAAGNGLTYEGMTGDLSNVNFSSGRMGWIEFSRNVQHWQYNMLVPKFCDGIMDWFIEAAALRGYVSFDADITISWTPPRREMIDPYKEVLGKEAEIRAGLISWSEAVREMGYDPDVLRKEMAEDAKAFDDMDLMPSSDPRYDPNRKPDSAAMREGTNKTGPDTVRE